MWSKAFERDSKTPGEQSPGVLLSRGRVSRARIRSNAPSADPEYEFSPHGDVRNPRRAELDSRRGLWVRRPEPPGLDGAAP